MTETIQIASFYHGPPDSGHGGYTSGLIAQLLHEETVEVTLRRPPPLDRPLAVTRRGDSVDVMDGDVLIAEARPAGVDVLLDVPSAVTYQDAMTASIDYAGFRNHLTPSCFVCGTAREPQEGLRIFPGPVRGRGLVAAPLVPERSLAEEDGTVKSPFAWAVLDCPSGWAVTEFVPGREAMLGRLTARIVEPLIAGRRYVVIGWNIGGEGRKMFSGSAVYGDDSSLRAAAQAIWIMLND